MSDRANVDVIESIYTAFGRGDVPAVLSRLDSQAELTFEGPADVPWTGRYQGHEGWLRFLQTLVGNVDGLTVIMTVFAADGDRVAASGRYHGTVKETGKRIDSPLVHLWTVRNGLVTSCLEMSNTAAEAAACTQAAGAVK